MGQKTTSQPKSIGLVLANGQISRRSWLSMACLLLILLFVWMWYSQQSIFGRLGYVPSSSRTVGSTTENFATGSTTKTTPADSTVTIAGGGSGGQTSTNTSTTTTTRDIERTSGGSPVSNPAPSSPTPAPSSPSKPTQDKMPILYASIDGGQDKQQLISLAGSNPDKCTQLTLDNLGQQEVCSWVSNNEAVTATLLNNQVTAKTKVGF